MTHWYIAKLKPGAGRVAKDRIGLPDERRDETVAERSIRDAGFECYFARMRKEIIHHRTRQIIVRRFPLLMGYIFVQLPTPNAEWLTGCGVIAYGLGEEGKLFAVDEAKDLLHSAEMNLEFDETREARLLHKREARTKKEAALRLFPKGAAVQVKQSWPNPHPFAGFLGQVTGATSKGKIKAVVDLFGRLTPVEFNVDELEQAA